MGGHSHILHVIKGKKYSKCVHNTLNDYILHKLTFEWSKRGWETMPEAVVQTGNEIVFNIYVIKTYSCKKSPENVGTHAQKRHNK